MGSPHRLTPRERIVRIGGGLAVIVGGCAIWVVSKAHDPDNRWALAGIVAVLAGLTWTGQGLRGRRDGPISHDEEVPVGDEVSAERTVAGVLAAWLVPGLGHWIIGRRAKATLYFTVITVTFLAGVLLAEGRNLSYERDGVYFLAYMFNAGETLAGWLLTKHLEVDHHIPWLQVGFLYTAVACLLNLVAIMDFVSSCSRRPEPAAAAEEPPEAQG